MTGASIAPHREACTVASRDTGIRVLMFCPQFAPIIGGAERQAEKLARMLVTQGVSVTLWTPRLDLASPDRERVDGVEVVRFPLSDLAGRFPRMHGIGVLNAPWITLQLIWRLRSPARTVDVVHCHIGSLQTVAVALAARLAGKPVICKAAMADDRSDLGEAAKGGVTGTLVAWLGRNVFNRWVATTQAVKSALMRAGVQEGKIVVIPNGVDLPSLATAGVKRALVRRFLYLGRLSTNIDRDVLTLLRAFDDLGDQYSDVELAIVGDGDLLDATRDMVAGCRHAERIQVPGQGDPAAWLAWADAFVLPSRREGLSNALLEAMAAGLPCIANDIPPNREVLDEGNAGLLVPVGAAADLCHAMTLLCADNIRATKFRRQALERARSRYSLVSVGERYKGLYHAVTSVS